MREERFMKLFTHTAKHCINKTISSDYCDNLPEVIRKHTDWNYSYQQKTTGCFLKPIFRNRPYRNSFVPEIDIVISSHDSQNVVQMSGRPVKPVRVFMALWFSILLVVVAFFIILAITSKLESLFPIFIPLVMCAFGYLLCKLATKVAFNSVVKAIKKEFS